MERRLTAQERDVLRLHGLGRSSTAIARDLGIGEMTVAWIIANLVAERGARRTEEIARSLAHESRRDVEPAPSASFADLAVPLAVMLVLSLAAFAALATTGTLHFVPASTASPDTASPPAFGSAAPSDPSSREAPGGVTPTIAPTAPPVAPTFAPVVPTTLPVLPTLEPVLPTIVPTVAPALPIPLPALPTVPPLPTPHLGPLSVP